MGLLSPVLVAVLVAIVLACVFGAVAIWPRLAGAGPGPVLARLGVLGVVNVSVLLLCFALLNDQYEFFGTWSDLVGAASGQVTTDQAASSIAGGDPAAAVAAPVATDRAVGQAERATVIAGGGSMTTYAVSGSLSGVTSQVEVLLPPGYSDPRNASHRYPVLMGVGGYPGTVSQLERAFHVSTTLPALAAERRVAPAIAVFVQPWTPAGRDTECVDGPGGRGSGDQVETWAAVDVPAWLRATFRTDTARTAWATWGVSAGAYCAAMMAMLHPDTFGAAISIAGYFSPSWGNWHPYAPGDPRAARYDLVAAASADRPPVALWLFASRHDSMAYPAATAIAAAARAPFSVTENIGAVGGHGYLWWTPWEPVALAWLGRTLPGFRPGSPA